jgi:hypothetical protein
MKDKTLNRYTTITVMLVAAFAAVVSYTHIRDLAMVNGYDWFTASILPLSVDGLIVGTSFMLVSASRALLRASVARFGLWLGIVATIAANVAYGLPHGVVGSTVSAWPAVAFIVAVEAWMQLTKHKKKTVKNTSTSSAGAKPTQRRTGGVKSQKTSKVTSKTQPSGEARATVAGGSTGQTATSSANTATTESDGVPKAYIIAKELGCGHAKSVQVRQIMIDDNVDMETAVKIRASWPHGSRKENTRV